MNATTVLLGQTDLARIGLGTNRLTNTEHLAFVRQAVELGVRMIDTAHTYTSGESEQTIGEALSPVPEGCIVATRAGTRPAPAGPRCSGRRSTRACVVCGRT